jgi:hypothetical protein
MIQRQNGGHTTLVSRRFNNIVEGNQNIFKTEPTGIVASRADRCIKIGNATQCHSEPVTFVWQTIPSKADNTNVTRNHITKIERPSGIVTRNS